jgi:hypothetical protein
VRQAEGRRARNVVARPLRRGADAQPARAWRRGAGRYFRQPRLGGMRFPTPAPRPGARRPSSVAATASVRMGMRGWRRALRPGSSASGNFTEMPTRSLHGHGAGAPDDNFQMPGLGGITRFAPPGAAARRRDRRRAEGDARGAEGTASVICAGQWRSPILRARRHPAASPRAHFTERTRRRTTSPPQTASLPSRAKGTISGNRLNACPTITKDTLRSLTILATMKVGGAVSVRPYRQQH